LEPIYGIDTVIKAFALFLQRIPSKDDVRLVIYGKGSKRQELEQLCETLRVDSKVDFKGYIKNSDVPAALNQMDLFCLGSRSESFGVAAVEAMACQLPVIATDADGLKEVIENNVTGYIVSQDSPREMADAIERLYRNESLRKKLGENGRKRVEELYDWEKKC